MIEPSFQDGGQAAPSGCRQAGEVRAPLAPTDLLLRDAAKSLPNGMDISAQDGWTQVAVELKAAQAMPGQGQGWRGTAGSARAMHWLGRVAVSAAVPTAWISAQHKPACLCHIPQPCSGPTWGFWQVLPHHTYLQGHAGRCRHMPGGCWARCTAAAHLAL